MPITHRAPLPLATLLLALATTACPLPDKPRETQHPCQISCTEMYVAFEHPCVTFCDFNLGPLYENNSEAAVVTLGGATDGTTCDHVAVCEDPTPCEEVYLDCLRNSGLFDLCYQQLVVCEQEEDALCDDARQACYNNADQTRDDCQDAGGGNDCMGQWYLDIAACDCTYDDCMGLDSEDCDSSSTSPPPPRPVLTSPGHWTVTRRALDFGIEHAARLEAFSRPWPVANTAWTAWRGIRLNRVAPRDPLYTLGLRQGDLLREINGAPITDISRSPAAINALRNTNQLTLELTRNGLPRTLHYQIVP